MSLRDVKPLWVAGMIIFVCALIVYIVGYATPHWFDIDTFSRFGLFKFCNLFTLTCYDISKTPYAVITPDLWRPGQALTSAGLALLIVGGILVFIAAAISKSQLSPVGIAFIVIGGILGLAGGIHFLVQGADFISSGGSFAVTWSAVILLIACIVEIISAIFLFVAYMKRDSVDPMQAR